MNEEGLRRATDAASLAEVERRLVRIEGKLDARTYVAADVFAQYQALLLEQHVTQNDRIAKLEAWQTSVYALIGTAFLGIIGSVIVTFVH